VLLILTKETVRGTALVAIPAAAVAACIWHFANRLPHPESKSTTPNVTQETLKTSPTPAAREEGTPSPQAFGRSRFEMAQQALWQHYLATARASIDQADTADPNNPSILNLRGEILLEQAEFELAEATFRKALEIDQKFREAQDNVAQLHKTAPEISPSGGTSPAPRNDPRLVFSPHPTCPSEARRKRFTGSGSFRISFDAGGEVISVDVVESTGQRVLDTNTVNTLKKWRATPHDVPFTIVVPITCTEPQALPHSRENSAALPLKA